MIFYTIKIMKKMKIDKRGIKKIEKVVGTNASFALQNS